MKKKTKRKSKQKKYKFKRKIKKSKKKIKVRKRIKKKTKKIKKTIKFKAKTKFKLPNFSTKKIKINKLRNQIEKITFQKVLGYLLEPIFIAYEHFREKRKLDKLRKIAIEKKEKEKQIKEERRLRYEAKQQELRNEMKLAKVELNNSNGRIAQKISFTAKNEKKCQENDKNG